MYSFTFHIPHIYKYKKKYQNIYVDSSILSYSLQNKSTIPTLITTLQLALWLIIDVHVTGKCCIPQLKNILLQWIPPLYFRYWQSNNDIDLT